MFLSLSAKGLLQHQQLENSLHVQDRKQALIFLCIPTCFVMLVDLNSLMMDKIHEHYNTTWDIKTSSTLFDILRCHLPGSGVSGNRGPTS